ncbi:uncharacterized protein LOC130622994 isoform X2 [Hydractinia symbiolongicarpus]|uniref:uncharacterized protein LOC130622994 isoform X2 n=1 Tax=Hydractinia symbiolongicarpus TaxID=13093 RepID=UPI00254BFE54|nr:uncharacterized protein LOC130622994 isoform X2 [Hydractinia symbiolongicarpus]
MLILNFSKSVVEKKSCERKKRGKISSSYLEYSDPAMLRHYFRSSKLKQIFFVVVFINLILLISHSSILHDLLFENNELTKEDLLLYTPANLSTQHIQSAMKKLETNPIYQAFDIIPPPTKEKVDLLLIVSSGPRRSDRRDAIRQTWWQQCVPTNGLVPKCIFITDFQRHNDTFYNTTLSESKLHKDIYFQKLSGGIEFGRRFLYHLVWAKMNFDFDYFMRVDDDYLFCLKRFLHEMPKTFTPNFHWGYTHHLEEGMVRPEESMVLFSKDVVESFLAQDPNRLLCHPWADQMIASWISRFPHMKTLLRHDDRLHHHPTVDETPDLMTMDAICDTFIGVHGCYPDNMRKLWKRAGSFNHDGSDLIQNTRLVKFSLFNWRKFIFSWRYKPKYCISNPTWDTMKQVVSGGVYAGRQEGGEVRSLSFFKRILKHLF